MKKQGLKRVVQNALAQGWKEGAQERLRKERDAAVERERKEKERQSDVEEAKNELPWRIKNAIKFGVTCRVLELQGSFTSMQMVNPNRGMPSASYYSDNPYWKTEAIREGEKSIAQSRAYKKFFKDLQEVGLKPFLCAVESTHHHKFGTAWIAVKLPREPQ